MVIVWARPPGAALFCAVVELGASVVTRCRGRWEPSAADVVRWSVEPHDRCGGCRRDLEMQARDFSALRAVHAGLRDGRSFIAACAEARERMTSAGIVYPGAALCEEDAVDCRARGLAASIGAWLRTMDEAELRRVDSCVVEILRGRE